MNRPKTDIDWKNEKERFIPVTVNDLVAQLSQDSDWSDDDNLLFKQFCKLYISLYHAKFFEKLQSVKDCYLPFSPDRSTLVLKQHSGDELRALQKQLISEIQSTIEKANYTSISRVDLNTALTEISPYGLNVTVDFQDFDEIHLFYRGMFTKTEQQRTWYTLYLGTKTVDVPIYRRLFLVVKLNPAANRPKPVPFQKNPKQYLLQKWRSLFRLDMTKGGDSSFIYLKLFKDIPRSDLEMLFPNTRIDIQKFDKVTMSVSGGGGVIGGIFAVVSKIVRAANMTTILVAVAGFIGIIWREIGKMFSNRNRYLASLAKSLYFHNLDNNLGVLSNLIEMAEAEEFKESILAYWFILKTGKKGCAREELDNGVEDYLSRTFGANIDFELDDGIRKLQESGLLIKADEGKLRVCSLKKAVKRLDREWDEMFTFAEEI